jgi:hypothetical protein
MPEPRSSSGRAYRAPIRLWLIALVVLLCTGCSAWHRTPEQKVAHELQAMQDAVPRHVDDPTRAARVTRAIHGLGTDLAEFRQVLGTMRDDLRAANARPDVTRGELERLVDTYDTRRRALRSRALARHAEMIAATTAREWQALAQHERKALSAAVE